MKNKKIEIVGRDNPVLRQKSQPILKAEFNTPKLRKMLKDMKTALDTEDDGVAIAAPQIGIPYRIFLISEKAFKIAEDEEIEKKIKKENNLVYINPVITKFSKDRSDMDEGCLSVRYLYGKVKRSNKATIEAYDETGKKFVRGASGLIAQIFQHETDHLNGILFIDKAKNVIDLPPDLSERRKIKEQIKNGK